MTKAEVLGMMYYEHFKFAKELSLVLEPNNPKRKEIEKVTNEIRTEWEEAKKNELLTN